MTITLPTSILKQLLLQVGITKVSGKAVNTLNVIFKHIIRSFLTKNTRVSRHNIHRTMNALVHKKTHVSNKIQMCPPFTSNGLPKGKAYYQQKAEYYEALQNCSFISHGRFVIIATLLCDKRGTSVSSDNMLVLHNATEHVFKVFLRTLVKQFLQESRMTVLSEHVVSTAWNVFASFHSNLVKLPVNEPKNPRRPRVASLPKKITVHPDEPRNTTDASTSTDASTTTTQTSSTSTDAPTTVDTSTSTESAKSVDASTEPIAATTTDASTEPEVATTTDASTATTQTSTDASTTTTQTSTDASSSTDATISTNASTSTNAPASASNASTSTTQSADIAVQTESLVISGNKRPLTGERWLDVSSSSEVPKQPPVTIRTQDLVNEVINEITMARERIQTLQTKHQVNVAKAMQKVDKTLPVASIADSKCLAILRREGVHDRESLKEWRKSYHPDKVNRFSPQSDKYEEIVHINQVLQECVGLVDMRNPISEKIQGRSAFDITGDIIQDYINGHYIHLSSLQDVFTSSLQDAEEFRQKSRAKSRT